MRSRIFIFMLVATLYACSQAPETTVEPSNFAAEGYELVAVDGSTLQKAIKRDANGDIIEEGHLENGNKTGSWITYYPDKKLPKSIINYVNGVATGLYLELNDRGQIEVRASYNQNKLDGPWGKYRFGRPTNIANYKNGDLDGTYKEFNMRDGKLLKEINYKNGQYHGSYKFFNENGEVTVEYEYNNGEKVSGGIIEKEEAETN